MSVNFWDYFLILNWIRASSRLLFFGCLPLWTSFMYGSKGSVTGGKQDGGGGADDKGHGRCQAGNAVLEICRFVICKSLHDCLLDCSACSAYQEVSPAQYAIIKYTANRICYVTHQMYHNKQLKFCPNKQPSISFLFPHSGCEVWVTWLLALCENLIIF